MDKEFTEEKDKLNYPDYIQQQYIYKITKGQTPLRLDVYLTETVPNATRNKVQQAISAGNVLVNGKQSKANKKVQPFDEIVCTLLKPPPIELVPEDIPLDITYEDDYLLVVNKPAGMCTHPGFGNRYGTLVNACLYHFGYRDSIPLELDDEDEELDDDIENSVSESMIYSSSQIRPGIVHRLDKDTSGLLVIAKDSVTHAKLAAQFAAHTSKREYNAIIWGEFKDDNGTIIANLGRSPRDRKLFAVVTRGGKHAITDYSLIERYGFSSLIRLKLHTGRTHQIRVHLSHNHHPIIGDSAYGGASMVYSSNDNILKNKAEKVLKLVNRQMLHAKTLGFIHPHTKQEMLFVSELPSDMLNVLGIIKA